MKLSSPRFRWILLLVALHPVVSLLAGYSSGGSSSSELPMAPMADMPAEVQGAATTVQQAYQFAVANPDALKNVPCYCGCGAMGHTSNLSCYVKEMDGNGKVVAFKFPKPPDLLAEDIKANPNGFYFDVITNGFKRMFSYGYRVKAPDRWAVIAYIRAMQLKNGPLTQDLTPDELQQLGK